MANVDTSATGGIGWRNLRTGILFIGGIIIAAILGLIIGKNTSLLSRHDTTYLFLADIRGLSEGNMVSISGKKIGVVQSMDFSERNDTTGVVVTLDVVHEYFHLITKDSKAVIRALGVLGDKYVDITLGHSEQLLQNGEYLAVVAEPGLEELTASALRTMTTIQEISAKINNGEGTIGKLITSNELNDKLMRTASNVEVMTRAMIQGDGLAARLITDKQMANHATSLMTNLSGISASLRGGKGTLGKLIMDETFYNRLSTVLQRVDSLVTLVNSPTGSVSKFTRDDEFYRHVDHTIKSLDELLMDFKENPGRYVKVSVF